MIKHLALGIMLVGSSSIALATPVTGDITAHRGFLSFVGSFFEDSKTEKHEILAERGFKAHQTPTIEHKPTSYVAQAPASAPEIDPASAVAGLTLLAGGILVMAASRRRTLTQA